MSPKVAVARYCCSEATHPDSYRQFEGDELVDEILKLSSDLRGLRVCEINATATGGGVAELLSRQIPIYRSLGLTVDWRLIYGDTVVYGYEGLSQRFAGGQSRCDREPSQSPCAEFLFQHRFTAVSDDEIDQEDAQY